MLANKKPAVLNHQDETVGLDGWPADIWHALHVICDAAGISRQDLLGPGRRLYIMNARRVFVDYLRHKKGLTQNKIAHLMGYQEHSTITYLLKSNQYLLQNNEELAQFFKTCYEELGNAECRIHKGMSKL